MTVKAATRRQSRTVLAEGRGLSVEYGEGEAHVAALQDVSVAIGPSERVALWGRSGSGKTTLLHVLGGLVDPTDGVVTWKGGELSSLDSAARARVRARGIAYVFQGAHLLPYFTAYENVAFAAAPMDDEPETERVEELLGLVGLASKARQPARRAVGRRGAAGGGRSSARPTPGAAALRRADRTPRLGHRASACSTSLMRFEMEFGFALVLATHDATVARRAERMLSLVDGKLS